MADLPILFSAPMVRALIAGTKTQTRRTFGKLRRFGPIHQFGISDTPGYAWHFRDSSGRFHDLRGGELPKYLPYKVGDRLYVREAWQTFASLNNIAPRDLWAPGCDHGAGILYKADSHGLALTKAGERWEGPRNDANAFGKHRQGMHMPKWASRITLIVEGVKIERLGDCNDDDAIAEGFEGIIPPRAGIDIDIDGQYWPGGPRRMYLTLWDQINGAGAAGGNPWVIAYTFRRIMGNIDQIPDVNSPQYLASQAEIAGRLCDGG